VLMGGLSIPNVMSQLVSKSVSNKMLQEKLLMQLELCFEPMLKEFLWMVPATRFLKQAKRFGLTI
jgi:hypothetical protein